ncbi:hypothetical protein CR513_52475, partial [Mucuna pruriens]
MQLTQKVHSLKGVFHRPKATSINRPQHPNASTKWVVQWTPSSKGFMEPLGGFICHTKPIAQMERPRHKWDSVSKDVLNVHRVIHRPKDIPNIHSETHPPKDIFCIHREAHHPMDVLSIHKKLNIHRGGDRPKRNLLSKGHIHRPKEAYRPKGVFTIQKWTRCPTDAFIVQRRTHCPIQDLNIKRTHPKSVEEISHHDKTLYQISIVVGDTNYVVSLCAKSEFDAESREHNCGENKSKEPEHMENQDRTLKELSMPDMPEPTRSYELMSDLKHLLPKFHGLAREYPHKHLNEFHMVCSTMRP